MGRDHGFLFHVLSEVPGSFCFECTKFEVDVQQTLKYRKPELKRHKFGSHQQLKPWMWVKLEEKVEKRT